MAGKATIAARLDLRHLATVALYWEMKEEETKQMLMPGTLSSLINSAIELQASFIIQKFPRLRVDRLEEAFRVLRSRGFALPSRDQTRRQLLKSIQEENLREEGVSPEAVEKVREAHKKLHGEDI